MPAPARVQLQKELPEMIRTHLFLLALVALFLASLPAPSEAAGRRRAPRPDCGLWLRPSADPAVVEQQLANARKAGFDTLYVETFYHGFVIYPSAVAPQRPEMKGRDYLRLYVDGARARQMKVCAWVETFYWEVDTSLYPRLPRTPLLQDHPEWRTVLRDGRDTTAAERGHNFANPAHPEVRRFLAELVKEMLSSYPLDGIALDYLRYPHGTPDAGYDAYTRQEYRRVAGLDPVDIPVQPENPRWQRWVEFRERQILALVSEVKQVCRATRPAARLGAAVFPSAPEARYSDSRFQNWREMLRRGLLDTILPMCYAPSVQGVRDEVLAVVADLPTSHTVALEPVLAVGQRSSSPPYGSNHPPIREQAAVVLEQRLPGLSIFCYDWMMNSPEGLGLLRGLGKRAGRR
jgi:uncharacterized lipoprotein YddW (UPF0748 family)